MAGAAVHALITERILTGMFLGKQGENYMIKDNQKSLNRFHVVLDAFVTAFSYLLAWFIVIGSGWANLLGKRTLEVGFYFGALLVIIPAYLRRSVYSDAEMNSERYSRQTRSDSLFLV